MIRRKVSNLTSSVPFSNAALKSCEVAIASGSSATNVKARLDPEPDPALALSVAMVLTSSENWPSLSFEPSS